MRKCINIKKLLLAGVMVVAGGTFWTSSDVHAVSGTKISGISISSACRNQYGWDDVELRPPYDVMSWKCRFAGSVVVYKGVNLDRFYCKKNWPGSHADYTNFNDPYSWGCYK